MVVEPSDAGRARAVLGVRGSEVTEAVDPLGVAVSGRFDHGRQLLPRVLDELAAAAVEVRAADVRVPTLDDVFLSLTGRSLREDAEVAA